MKRVFEIHLNELNDSDRWSLPRKKKVKNIVKNGDIWALRVIGAALGIMTMRVAVEQMAMQLGKYFR